MFVYLHGLNSSGLSSKAGILRGQLEPLPLLAPSYPAHRPDEAVETLTRFFAGLGEESRPVVVGSSMGGFYGQYLARHFPIKHLYMINPALRPWSLLSEFEGQTMTTALGIEYRITRELIESTRRYGIADPRDGVATTLFLDKGDEVIDYRIAESIYRTCGRVILYEGGDHAFQHIHEAIAVMRESL